MAGRGKSKGLPKSGGRQKGAVDKIKREAILAAQGITPLDYMMMLVRAENPVQTRPVWQSGGPAKGRSLQARRGVPS
jgi:hypothetical protein